MTIIDRTAAEAGRIGIFDDNRKASDFQIVKGGNRALLHQSVTVVSRKISDLMKARAGVARVRVKAINSREMQF
jgi:hypothetical protein